MPGLAWVMRSRDGEGCWERSWCPRPPCRDGRRLYPGGELNVTPLRHNTTAPTPADARETRGRGRSWGLGGAPAALSDQLFHLHSHTQAGAESAPRAEWSSRSRGVQSKCHVCTAVPGGAPGQPAGRLRVIVTCAHHSPRRLPSLRHPPPPPGCSPPPPRHAPPCALLSPGGRPAGGVQPSPCAAPKRGTRRWSC